MSFWWRTSPSCPRPASYCWEFPFGPWAAPRFCRWVLRSPIPFTPAISSSDFARDQRREGMTKRPDDDDGQTRVRGPEPLESAPAGRDRAYLIVLAGMSRGQMFKLDSPRSVIGRGSEALVKISDEGISREHAVVHLVDGKVSV